MFGKTFKVKLFALDNISTNVMIADENMDIIYVNKSLLEFLREAEPELKEDLPHFDVTNLVGSNVDIFHKHPAQQRAILKKLSDRHSATMSLGRRAFDLCIQPVLNGGERIGFVVEWADAKERLLNLDYSAQISAFGRAQAIIEFAPDGTIIGANENFLRLMGYSLHEIQGMHHRIFVDANFQASAEYSEFWRRLGRGEYQAGDFKRIGKGGKECWIQGSYNPILDMNGRVAKIVKFALDVTGRVEAVRQIAHSLGRLAEGDISQRIDVAFIPELDPLRVDFNASMQTLQKLVVGIRDNIDAIRAGTEEIATAATDLSHRTEHQASSLEQTAAALDEITATVKKSAEGAAYARNVVAAAKRDADESGEVVRKAIASMISIEESSKQIGHIISIIDEIAFQTSLLALNAGVEAARAGEAGRGFAVVASEVRGLAQRAAESAKKIKTLVSTSTAFVGQGVLLVNESGNRLEKIVGRVAEMTAIINDIALGAEEQASGLQEVNIAVNQMDQVTQQNAAMVEETSAATRSLADKTDELGRLIRRFKVDQTSDELRHKKRSLA